MLTAAVPAAATTTAARPADESQHQRRVRNILVAIGAAVVLRGFLLIRSCGGPTYVKMPTVVGLPYAKAAATLDAAGLHADRRAVHTAGARAGTVIRQSERAGTRLSKGTAVTLTVSSGPPTVQIRAADLLGRPVGDVERELTSEHLRVAVESAPSKQPAGTVTAVAPTGALREGSTVTVTVAAAPAPRPKPKDKHGPHDHGH